MWKGPQPTSLFLEPSLFILNLSLLPFCISFSSLLSGVCERKTTSWTITLCIKTHTHTHTILSQTWTNTQQKQKTTDLIFPHMSLLLFCFFYLGLVWNIWLLIFVLFFFFGVFIRLLSSPLCLRVNIFFLLMCVYEKPLPRNQIKLDWNVVFLLVSDSALDPFG